MLRISYRIVLVLFLISSLPGTGIAIRAQEKAPPESGESPRRRPAARIPADSQSTTTKSQPATDGSRTTPADPKKDGGSESNESRVKSGTSGTQATPESAGEPGGSETGDPEAPQGTESRTESQPEKGAGRPAARPARKPAPTHRNRKEQNQPATLPAQTVRLPAGKTSVPLPQQDGIADDFGPFPETIIPGARKLQQTEYPHQGENGDFMKIMRFDDPLKQRERREKPGGFWDRMAERVGSEKTVINILLLLALIAIFGWYRLRGGGASRKRFE